MKPLKDTKRASVRVGFDGRVHKHFLGPFAKERYQNEIRVLHYLEEENCPFVPKVLECHDDDLYLVTCNCGHIVENLSPDRIRSLFSELESYGVRHDDPFPRNVTYHPRLGRFCIIDFEFAVILETGEGLTTADLAARLKEQ